MSKAELSGAHSSDRLSTAGNLKEWALLPSSHQVSFSYKNLT